VAIVNASIGLALKCGKIAADLKVIASTWKQAELSVLELINNCRMLETVLRRIDLVTKYPEIRLDDDTFQQLQSSLELGGIVISALEQDLNSVMNIEPNTIFRQKTKIMWQESVIKMHQERVTRQLTAITVLLKLMEL